MGAALRVWVGTLLSPFGACLFPTGYPRHAPWAAFLRRFAAKGRKVIPDAKNNLVLTLTLSAAPNATLNGCRFEPLGTFGQPRVRYHFFAFLRACFMPARIPFPTTRA